MTKKIARENVLVELEPHVCRSCFGRIASTKNHDGTKTFQCTSCGLSAVGGKASVVCACGIRLRTANAGIRCHKNLAASPEFPALYVASFGGTQST